MKLRELSVRFIEAALTSVAEEAKVNLDASRLSTLDRALFEEISLGTLREWFYLKWVVGRFAKRSVDKKLWPLLLTSAYQILFLDRVPSYAVFSEMKNIATSMRFQEPQQKFMHAILKSMERQKTELRQTRKTTLEKLKTYQADKAGIASSGFYRMSDVDWAVLNTTAEFFEKQIGSDAHARNVFHAFVAYKHRPEIIGYGLPPAKNLRHLVLNNTDLQQPDRRFVVQGPGSQKACEHVANVMLTVLKEQPFLNILELASGKGGKCLGALAALTVLLEGESFPVIEWQAYEPSKYQRMIFEKDTLPLIQKYWPSVKVSLLDTLPKPTKVDMAWIDAPCSGLGIIARHPQIQVRMAEHPQERSKSISELHAIQVNLMHEAAQFNPSHLFYSVCTVTAEETTQITSQFGSTHPGFKLAFQEQVYEPEGFYLAEFITVN